MVPGAGSEAELRRGGRAGEREDSDGACGLAAGWRRERVKMVPTVVCAQSIPAGSLTC